jgi:hypothetical protein
MKRLLILLPIFLLPLAAQAATPAGWQSYHDARGFTVSFPAGWKADPDYYDSDYPSDGQTPPRIHALAIVPTGDLQPGTTLNSRAVLVAIVPLPAFRSVCAASSFVADPAPDYGYAFDADTPDQSHRIGGDPGGWYTDEDYLWRISTTPCVGVRYAFSYHADGSDQAKSEKPLDRAKLLRLLDAIRATVALDPAH